MASVNINVTNFQTWENTGIAAPCLVESHSGDVFVNMIVRIFGKEIEVAPIPIAEDLLHSTATTFGREIWTDEDIRLVITGYFQALSMNVQI